MSGIGVHGWDNIKDVESFIERNSSLMSSKFFGVHGDSYLLNLSCEKEYLAAYNLCSPLKSIISKRSKAFNSGITKVINRNTGKEVKSGRAAEIRKLLKKPNALQTESQFMAQQNHYTDIFGYCPVLKIRPAGMASEISSMWNIPPWLFDIEYTKKWLNQSNISGIYSSYFMTWEGERVPIPFKDLFFIFDDGIGTEYDTNLTIPDSRLLSNDFVVANIVAAYKSRNTLITKRGAIGILSNETVDGDSGSVPMRKEDKEDLQKDFKKYGLVGQAFQVIISDANLKWQQMGFPTKELMLFEEIEDDINRLCDAYGVPSVLMARGKDTTFENQNQGRKDFIENTIIPESAQRKEMLTNGVIEDDESLQIVTDYSGLAVMQEDKAKAATARKTLDDALQIEYKAGLITKNDWREKLGEERLSLEVDPTGDSYFDAAAEAEVQHQRAVEIAQSKRKVNAAA